MAANPFTAQLDSLGAPSVTSLHDASGGTTLPGGRVGRRLRRAAKKASQASTTELLGPSSPAPLPAQHVMNGRSHQHMLEKTGK